MFYFGFISVAFVLNCTETTRKSKIKAIFEILVDMLLSTTDFYYSTIYSRAPIHMYSNWKDHLKDCYSNRHLCLHDFLMLCNNPTRIKKFYEDRRRKLKYFTIQNHKLSRMLLKSKRKLISKKHTQEVLLHFNTWLKWQTWLRDLFYIALGLLLPS